MADADSRPLEIEVHRRLPDVWMALSWHQLRCVSTCECDGCVAWRKALRALLDYQDVLDARS